MKVCRRCNTQKETTEFKARIYKNRPNNPYISNMCIVCERYVDNERSKKFAKENPEKVNEINRRIYHNQKDGKCRVYMLPNENNYVGQTVHIKKRMDLHKSDGNNTTDYRVLMACDTVEDAKELESLLHDMGYPGKYGHKKIPSH